MQPIFWAQDLRILPLLRALEKLGVGGDWLVSVGGEPPIGSVYIDIESLLMPMMPYIASKTRLGRVAVVGVKTLSGDLEASLRDFYVSGDKRGEESLSLSYFDAPGLSELAYAGLGDGVEFRRLARKYFRKIKDAHCDLIFLVDPIFSELTTKKVLQHIAGTQIRVCGLDKVVESWGIEDVGKANYSFQGIDIADKPRVEQLLQRKLKDEVFN